MLRNADLIIAMNVFLMLTAAAAFGQSPHGSALKMDCANCHLATTWNVLPKQMKFNHDKMTSFALVGQHAQLACVSCHKDLVFSDVKSNCVSCHSDVHRASLGVNCQDCHTPHTWLVTDVQEMHQRTRFPLVGAHQNVDCASCHTSYSQLYFPPINTACVTCHSQQYYSTTAPNHAQAGFSTQCQSCHTVIDVSWGPTNFNHSFFPLTGGHAIANCFACHTQGATKNFGGLSTNCYSCHNAQFAQTTAPNHASANFSHDCSQCHTITNWGTGTFDHNTTGFPLTGEHTNLLCAQCHTSGYTNTPSDCYSCHQTNYTNATAPVNHPASGLPHTCQGCHTTSALFTTATFNHPTAPFQLTGAHASLACQSCHQGSVTNTPTDCYSCHTNDFAATNNPNHVSAGFPHTCTQCHSTTDWTSATFDHSTTGFPLTGDHANLQCAQCHASGYTNTPSNCYACHQADYTNATTPVNHVAAGLPQTCQDCHTTMSPFTTTTFSHPSSPFALTGAHTTVACQSCHKGSVTSTPTDCYSCHSNDFAATTNPNHVSAGFPHTCTQCHSTTDWTSATFDHSTTGFPLTGEHANLQCAQCHASGYTNTPSDCYSCHQTDYTNATTPVNHVAAGLPQTCQNCHTTMSPFTTTTFNHSSTPFQLTGAHTTVACQSCHQGSITNTPTDCYSCHKTDYTNTTDPPHVAQGFPTTCNQCHSTTSWDNATFDHSTTGFPLTGAHTSVQCAQCHTNGYTTPPPTTCVGCHQTDYNNTTNPPHASAGYPTDCTQCHTTTAWSPSTFNHSQFPITSGNHAAPPLLCSQCHTNVSNFAIFSCTTSGCHPQAQTDPHHTGVNGYVYSPTSCYTCHPTGSGD